MNELNVPPAAATAVERRLRPAPAPVVGVASKERRAGRARAARSTGPHLHPATATILVTLLGITVVGLPYYLLPVGDRARHPFHPWLKPSGYIGQTAGLLAIAIFVFLWLYSLRKHVRWLAWTGGISRWLDAHVLLALPLPLLVAIHSAWRFDGIIGLGFWAMMVVWLSGIVGRYLYAKIPRSKAGIDLSIEEIAAQRKSLLEEIAAQTGLEASVVESALAADPPPSRDAGFWTTLRRMATDDLARRRAAKRLHKTILRHHPLRRAEDRARVRESLRLAKREMALTQQAQMLEATHRLFRFWHVAHRPVAVTALAAVLIHVAVVVSLGATWLW
jgi:hypothetical protein